MSKTFNFTGRAVGSINVIIDNELIQVDKNGNIRGRDEIARVFQRANRRIQNIEKSGLYSPAVASLGDMGDRFTKFSLSGLSGYEIAMQYAKAVGFLQQPTSTATGARQYNEQVRERYNLTKEEYTALSDDYMGKITSLTGSDFVEVYLKRYKDFSGDFQQAVKSSSEQIESDARKIVNAIDDVITGNRRNLDGFHSGLDLDF